MLLGDVEGRVNLLEKAGQQELATLTRKIHHLNQEDFEDHGHPTSQTAQLLLPPPPLITADYPWPTHANNHGLKRGEIMKEGYRDLAVGSP